MTDDITARYHGGNPESVAAHESIVDTKHLLRMRIVAYVVRCGMHGATSDEVEKVMQLPHQTTSARLAEAKARGELVASGRRRLTRHGRSAAVLISPDLPPHACDTCGEKCVGGCLDYTSARNELRHGCVDHRTCAKTLIRKRYG